MRTFTDAFQCQGQTAKGTPCRNRKRFGDYCGQHRVYPDPPRDRHRLGTCWWCGVKITGPHASTRSWCGDCDRPAYVSRYKHLKYNGRTQRQRLVKIGDQDAYEVAVAQLERFIRNVEHRRGPRARPRTWTIRHITTTEHVLVYADCQGFADTPTVQRGLDTDWEPLTLAPEYVRRGAPTPTVAFGDEMMEWGEETEPPEFGERMADGFAFMAGVDDTWSRHEWWSWESIR